MTPRLEGGEGFKIGFLMKLRIISWNVRGVNDAVKRKRVKI